MTKNEIVVLLLLFIFIRLLDYAQILIRSLSSAKKSKTISQLRKRISFAPASSDQMDHETPKPLKKG